ncbi:hypothetical protein [Shewanella woodyi]|uniref:hypothetical protein n=1 Tax=Shewanella woodyi TaxID=60961 RepID=UPI0007F93BE6|nr:hypothetical protein [Shewanella woodyi]
MAFRDKARYREVILFERETRMPSWQLNKDVVCHGRAHRAENVPDIFSAFPTLTHRDMGNVFKASGTLKTLEVRYTCNDIPI